MVEGTIGVQEGTDKNLRTQVVGGNHQEVVTLAKTDGTILEDPATQTTLALIKLKTDNLDVLLSTRALESGGKLADILTKLNTMGKHDAKVYAPAVFDSNASGNLVAAVAGKVTKLHAIFLQAQGTVTVNLNDGAGGTSRLEFKALDTHGAVLPPAPAPMYWAITSVNTALYVTLSAAVQVTITAIISSDDAS